MTMDINREAYQKLVDEDVAWIEAQPRTLERDHVIDIVKHSVSAIYDGKKFKDYTHQRLSELGAPHEVPESEHTKAGCRVGGRFDWVMAELAALRSRIAALEEELAEAKRGRALAERAIAHDHKGDLAPDLIGRLVSVMIEVDGQRISAEGEVERLREAAAKAEEARIDAEEARLRAEMLSDEVLWREAAEEAEKAMTLASADLCQWRQLGHYQRKQSPNYSRDPLCATDAGMAQTEDAITAVGIARAKLAALLAPQQEKEQPKPVVLPNPELAYKAVMAQSEQLAKEGSDAE